MFKLGFLDICIIVLVIVIAYNVIAVVFHFVTMCAIVVLIAWFIWRRFNKKD